MVPNSSPQSEVPATVFGAKSSYSPVKLLGGGGMASVWLARGSEQGSLFAVKHPKMQPERLRIEHDAARVHHRFIAQSHELIEDDKTHAPTHLVMEFVRGESLLARRERDGQFSVEDSVKVAHDIALALDHLHQQGWIHRDVSPPNIMWESDTNNVKLIDFGIARRIVEPLAPFGRMTELGFFIGNPGYCAPEQFLPGAAFGPATDIYALGGVLYYLLTGSPPFNRDRYESKLRPFPEIRSRLTGDGTPLANLVEACTRNDPRDRITAEGVVEQAESILTSKTSTRVRPENAAPAVPPAKEIQLEEFLASRPDLDAASGSYFLQAEIQSALIVADDRERRIELGRIEILKDYKQTRNSVIDFDPSKPIGDVLLTCDHYIRIASGRDDRAQLSNVFPLARPLEVPRPGLLLFDSGADCNISCLAEDVDRFEIDSTCAILHPAVVLSFVAQVPRKDPMEIYKLILAR